MDHPLDNPIWHALHGPHRQFAIGSGRAVHYPRDMAAFSAIADAGAEAHADLARHLPAGADARLLRRAVEPLPAGWGAVKDLPLLQMVAQRFDGRVPDGPPVATLGPEDVDIVSALVERTQPGPFGPRTLALGRYLGVFEDGELVALAGERLRLPGFVELSAVCTDPRVRGRGLAAYLMRHLMRAAVGRGETPFLHVVPDNALAIAIYRRLGFDVRAGMHYLWRRPVGIEAVVAC